MYKPELYFKFKDQISFDVYQVLEEFNKRFGWSSESENSLLDIGCGSGSLTNDFLMPLLSGNSVKVVGADISAQMITFATDKYSEKNSNIKFEIMDITDDKLIIHEKFNVVTSFYVFHFVRNLRQAFQNIYNLLKPGGTVLIIHLINSPLISAITKSHMNPKWRSIIKQKNLLNPNYDDPRLAENDFTTLLMEEGFKDIFCEARKHTKEFKNVSEFLTFAEATNPYNEFIPDHLCKEYYRETLDEFSKKGLIEDIGLEKNREPKVFLPITTLIIFAKKL